MTSPSRSAARRVATARTISLTGTAAASIALLFVVYDRTHSSAWVAATLLATLGAQGVLSPFAGALGDRFERRTVMILSDLAAGGCFAAMAFVRSPGSLLAVAFLAVLAESPFSSAASASIPNLVGPQDLAWATGTVAFGSSLGYVMGPALGGLLVAGVGPSAVFLLNAASFVGSAALVATIGGRFSVDRPGGLEEHHGVRAGFAWIRRDPVLRRMTVAFAVFAVSVGSILVAELPLAASVGAGAVGFGLMSAAFDFGALFGALAARRLPERREFHWLAGASFVTAASFGSMTAMPSLGPMLGAMAVGGTSDGLVDVVVSVIYQRRSPDAVRSRVMAALEAVFLMGLAVAFPVGGFLVDRLGPRPAYFIAGIGCTVTAAMLVPLALPARIAEPAIE